MDLQKLPVIRRNWCLVGLAMACTAGAAPDLTTRHVGPPPPRTLLRAPHVGRHHAEFDPTHVLVSFKSSKARAFKAAAYGLALDTSCKSSYFNRYTISPGAHVEQAGGSQAVSLPHGTYELIEHRPTAAPVVQRPS